MNTLAAISVISAAAAYLAGYIVGTIISNVALAFPFYVAMTFSDRRR